MEYRFAEVEKKWQEYWEREQVYRVSENLNKPKYYVLDMFPYPSGAGLHVGHPLGYIASDIYSRYKRSKGFNVLHPMGFDAFGLPAEQYAIETGQHPAVTTEKNIARYKEQLKNIGFCFDWSRQVITADPEYYKWTQWIFLQFFDSWYDKDLGKARPISDLQQIFYQSGNGGLNAASSCLLEFTATEWTQMDAVKQEEILQTYRLAYLAYSDVNWCPALGTVLANDEVKDGVSERGGHPVEKKKMRQWFLRITAYADRLLNGLDQIDWSDSLKEQQRNWIGKSRGAEVTFLLSDSTKKLINSDGISDGITVFTTRPDTIFGATFIVLAPEHELVRKITTPDKQEAVDAYLKYVQSRSDVERQQEKKVTGEFTGAYVSNPFTGKDVPVWIAEYVLAGYGTGAVMAVPSDDDRDHIFAEKFGLEIIEVIDKSNFPGATRDDKVGKMINSGFINGMDVLPAIDAVITRLEEMGIGRGKTQYRLRDAGFSRQRYWGEPFPVIYKNGIPEALPESSLPVILPEVQSYKPTGDGEAPLAGNHAWANPSDNTRRETDTMPGYAGSSWYWLRYMNPTNSDALASKDHIGYWREVDLYIGGSEHAVGHLLYARFWNKFLHDIGIVPVEEPFKKLINQGMIQGRSSIVYRLQGTNVFISKGLVAGKDVTPIRVDVNMVENDVLDTARFKAWREDYADAEFELEEGKYICGWEVEKMSKRWHNVVNPDDMVAKYGADCFRMYEMFLGPIEQHKPWDTQGIEGVSRFIRKMVRLYTGDTDSSIVTNDAPTPEELKILHRTIKKVTEDTERFSFNTVVSTFMICVNELSDLKCHKREILEPIAILISPYAPHLSEELWSVMGNSPSVTALAYPLYDEKHLVESSFSYPISFNGKVRFKIDLPIDLPKEVVEKEVLSNAQFIKWMEGKEPKKMIVVPNRIVNVVV